MRSVKFTLKYSLIQKRHMWFCSDGEVAGKGLTKESAKSAYGNWRTFHTLNRTPFSSVAEDVKT